jgi:NAD(P)H-nitrite reductase large subunit
MNKNNMAHIVIIGNGISGITCARHIRKQSADQITVIGAETEHFFSRTALMYIYMGHMQYEHTKPYEDNFWKKNNIALVFGYVSSVDTSYRMVRLQDGTKIGYDQLVIACGSKYNIPGITGIGLKGVQGLYSYPDLQQMEGNTKSIRHAVIAGGGLIGIEMAEMLLSRKITVTMIIREREYWSNVLPAEESRMIARHMRDHHINLLHSTEIMDINGDETGKVISVKINTGEIIPCEFVGLTIGVSPNIGFLATSGVETDRGVLVNDVFETNIPDVFAIGDCAQFRTPPPGRKAVEQVWYTGRLHAETLACTLTGKRTAYRPAPWFNSAKFLDIEYQTYGHVPAEKPEDDEDFYWENASENLALRIRYEKATGTLLGVNVLGIRLRHAVMENWILQKKDINEVLVHLDDANFDPEFSKNYKREIIDHYNIITNAAIKPVKRDWKRILQILNP